MKFTLRIDLGHDGMESARDVARALQQVAKKLRGGHVGVRNMPEGAIFAPDGESVGYYEVIEGDQSGDLRRPRRRSRPSRR